MYKTHATYIQRTVELGGVPELANVVRFTLATIRFPLWQAAKASRTLITGEGDYNAARRQVLWGSKRKGFKYLETSQGLETLETATRLAAMAKRVERGVFGDVVNAMNARAAALLKLADVPGLGLVKAGFVTQQAFGFGGCIDTHNLRLYGVPDTAVQLGGVKLDGEAAARKARAYLKLCNRLGGPARLWDAWCEFVAETQPNRYENADAVSFAHLYGLGLAG